MKDKEQFPDKPTSWEQDTYQTGSTRPPKSYGGIIAFLLVLVIFLCGISTALGLMNIRLFHQLNAGADPDDSPLAFSQVLEDNTTELFSPLGFSGQSIPEIWSVYQNLPRGIYITEVAENSDAALKGICPGDILLRVNETPVTDSSTLHQLLNTEQLPAAVPITIYRTGKQLHFTLKLHTRP